MNLPFISQLLGRYGLGLAKSWPLGLVALGVALGLALAASRGWLRHVASWRRYVLLAAVATGAVLWAWQLRWLCDDAYISFRYADNWAKGLGPVFNPGERVEGYTDFLWTAIMAAAIKVGLDPGQVAIVLCLASLVGTLLLLDVLSRRLSDDRAGTPGIAPLLAAASYTMASFGTSGLETMFAAALALLAVERAEARRPLAAGLAGIASTMAHPDHALLYAALGLAMALTPDRRRQLGWYLLPLGAIYLPYFLWRWHYYGDFFPNTYYAKSGDKQYWGQGSVYVFFTFVAAGVWALTPLAALGAVRFRKTVSGKYFLIAVPLFSVYVAKIGGDFMMGRLMVPALALVFLFADVGFRDLVARGRRLLGAGLVALAALAAVPVDVIRPGEKFWNLADERTFYRLGSFSPPRVESTYAYQARSLSRVFTERGLSPRLGLGCVGIVGYHTRLPIFDLFGLTSRSVAHMPILTRGRPGHEKVATIGHVLGGGVDVAESPVFPEPWGALTAVELDGYHYNLTHYDQRLVSRLTEAGAVLQDFGGHLRSMTDPSERRPPEHLACELWFLEDYYFSAPRDPETRRAIVASVVAQDSSLRPLEPLLLDKRSLAERGYVPVRTFGFERHEPGLATGDAFAGWPQSGGAPGQTEVFGHRGRFINTFQPGLVDGARGTLRLPPFTITGDVISLLVGGGRDPIGERVTLVVDGQPVRSATGCVSEVLARRLWDVKDLRGKTAQIEVVDDSEQGWGHLLVDEITEWRAR